MSEFPFSRPQAFRFDGWSCEEAAGRVRLRYAFEPGPRFEEILSFSAPLPAADSPLRPGFAAALDALHLAAGISYYKAFLPPNMIVAGGALSPAKAAFFQTLYENGLGEFSARNRIKAWERIAFPVADRPDPPPPSSPPSSSAALPRRSAVLVGGGKDSLVSIEALRAGAEPMLLFAVNPKTPILACAEKSGLPFVSVRRQIDEGLFALNDQGALNGHIPITAIVSLIAAAAAFVYGFDTVVVSNERSANEGNLEYEGRIVNHQYSKTLAFERMLAAYLHAHVAPELTYFSLLRPLSELHIAQAFAEVDRYDAVFTSCNRAFVLRPGAAPVRWCCDCPKCRFAFLILATAMGPQRLTAIFGANLLEDEKHLSGYEELSGLSGHKPWECVGEIAESSAALLHLAADPAWASAKVVTALAPRLREKMPDWRAVEAALLTPTTEHGLPGRYEKVLHAYVG